MTKEQFIKHMGIIHKRYDTLDMLYYDLKVLLNDAPQGPAPVMQTAFSYQVLPFAQVEREYLELFEALMSEVHGA